MSQSDYNRKSLAKKKARGLVRVEVWVPGKDREKLKAYAEKLRSREGSDE